MTEIESFWYDSDFDYVAERNRIFLDNFYNTISEAEKEWSMKQIDLWLSKWS